MTVNIYQSTDAESPDFSAATNGSLIDLFKACLVNGYGTGGNAKAAAGWTLELESSNKAIFKNSTGAYFKVKDDGSPRTDKSSKPFIATVTGALSYSDIDTLTTPFPRTITGTNLHSTTWYGAPFVKVWTGDWASRTDIPWIVVADDKTCYFLSKCDMNNWVPHVMGDMKLMANVSNYPKSMVVGFSMDSFDYISEKDTPMLNTGNADKYMAFPLSGGYESTRFALCRTLAIPQTGGYAGNGGYYHVYPSPITGGAVLEPFYISDSISDGTDEGMENYRFAKFPGFYSCAHKLDGTTYAIGYSGDILSVDGKTYLLLLLRVHQTSFTPCAYAIDLTGPW